MRMKMDGALLVVIDEKLQYDPNFNNYILFYEYFHGDNGQGLGASHQTGWTGLSQNFCSRGNNICILPLKINFTGRVAAERNLRRPTT